MDSESRLKSQSLSEPRSESKVLMGQKRGTIEVEETSENSHKRVKMRHLDSVFRSEAQTGVQVGGGGGSNLTYSAANVGSRALDHRVNIDAINGVVGDNACVKETNKLFSSKTEDMECKDGFEKPRGVDFDLNVEDVSSSINSNPLHPYKNYENLKSRDDSECGSSVGPSDEKDSMKLWNKIKQNGYMSTTRYGAVPMTIPKPRGRKSKNDMLKKKIELAKKEQIDRFARVAAPSGLLNGLNPGIINHVRNSKQVHSIIEALVRSARNENQNSGSKPGDQMKSGVKELSERKNMENVNISGAKGFEVYHEDMFLGSRQIKSYPFFSGSLSLNSEVTRDGDSHVEETRTFGRMPSKCNTENEDDGLMPNLLSSANVASENNSSLSNESANFTNATSISVKAANVASQWLELLNQDIKGRLAALRRSKKRVRAVIQTELPFLMSKDFPSNQEKGSYTTKGSTVWCPGRETAEAHRARWSVLFAQMDKALSEEESHLETWLNQVKEMQLHCDKGLYKAGVVENENRLGEIDKSEKDLSVRAAAASIYSTCDFLLSMENQPCP